MAITCHVRCINLVGLPGGWGGRAGRREGARAGGWHRVGGGRAGGRMGGWTGRCVARGRDERVEVRGRGRR